jgi:hypothetical protein
LVRELIYHVVSLCLDSTRDVYQNNNLIIGFRKDLFVYARGFFL